MYFANHINPAATDPKALNADLSFDRLTPEQQHAFDGMPMRVLLPAWTPLFRMTSGPPIGSNDRFNPWWCFYEDTKIGERILAAGYQQLQSLMSRQDAQMGYYYQDRRNGNAPRPARTDGIYGDLRDGFRALAAVKLEWNNLTHLVEIAISLPTMALVGAAAPQPLAGNSLSRLPGGIIQVFVGGLIPSEVRSHVKILKDDPLFSAVHRPSASIRAEISRLFAAHPEMPRNTANLEYWYNCLRPLLRRHDEEAKRYAMHSLKQILAESSGGRG